MRIVGRRNRSEIELDPVKAYQRGRKLDAMLRAAAPNSPRELSLKNASDSMVVFRSVIRIGIQG